MHMIPKCLFQLRTLFFEYVKRWVNVGVWNQEKLNTAYSQQMNWKKKDKNKSIDGA